MPWLPMYCHAPAVIPGMMVRPMSSRRRRFSSRLHSPTMLPFAMITSGVVAWPGKTPIGLPDWTTKVWSSRMLVSVATMRSKAFQSRAARAIDM